MSYLYSDHQRALAPLLYRDAGAGSDAPRRSAELPHFDAPTMVPVHKPVPELTVGLLVSLGAHAPGQEPLQRTNDLSYRLIPRTVPNDQIVFDHATPARFWADEDLNVAFPRDRMAELEAEGTIGALAPDAVSILGSITKWKQPPPKPRRASTTNSAARTSISFSSYRSARNATRPPQCWHGRWRPVDCPP